GGPACEASEALSCARIVPTNAGTRRRIISDARRLFDFTYDPPASGILNACRPSTRDEQTRNERTAQFEYGPSHVRHGRSAWARLRSTSLLPGLDQKKRPCGYFTSSGIAALSADEKWTNLGRAGRG